jgi:glycerol-3-phosphate dehydrogenase
MPRTRCVSARRVNGAWRAVLRRRDGARLEVSAQAIANVTGPWVRNFLRDALGERTTFGLKLIKGSHIVVPRLYEGEHAYILQNDDRRVVFVYPYEGRYTLIGTTDVELQGEPGRCEATAAEVSYLCRAVNRYFARQIAERDLEWSYCGIRPLFDDGSADPSSVTRDYVLRVDGHAGQAPVLSVFGGKITTHRRLAELALAKLEPWFSGMRGAWTATKPLPGGELGGRTFEQFADSQLGADFPWLPVELRRALAGRHGALAYEVLGQAADMSAMGEHFGADLYAREIDYLRAREWACDAEDVLWRRTKAGLHLGPAQRAAVASYMERHAPAVAH